MSADKNPLVQKSYVDRSIEEVREEARRSAVAVQSQLVEASKRLAYHIDGLDDRASKCDQRLTAQVEEVVRSIDSLRDYTAAVRVRVEKAEDSASIRKLLAELSERVDKVEERAKPIIETLGRMGAGGGFFSAKPGKDKVAVGGADGMWELVDKGTLGGGGGGGAPTDASYVTTAAEAGLSAEKVLGTDVVMRGTLAARPSASLNGRLYLATDEAGGTLYRDTGAAWEQVAPGVTGGGVTDAGYLVTAAHAGLSDEVVVGATPGGELGGTWDAPTVDAVHSGSSHAAVQAAAEATAAAADAAHVAAADPHAGYQKESEKGAVGGYAALDGGGTVPDVQIPAAITRDTELAAHVDDTVDAHDASAVSNIPAGTIAATTVQAALDELDSEKVPNTRTITAGAALTGGGTLAADRTLDVAVDGDTLEISGDALQVRDIARITRRIAQVAHGLAVGDVVRYSGTAYAKAQANIAANAEVVGVVSAVADTDNFTLQLAGRVTGLTGLTAGTVYFLSPTTAGAFTATEPTTVGQISKPLLVSDSTTSGYFFNFRGAEVDSAASYIAKSIVDAKGDLIVGTAADTVARKAIGTDDTVLAAASAQADGAIWKKIVDAMIDANAAISRSKLATVTRKELAQIVGDTNFVVGDNWPDASTSTCLMYAVVPDDYVSGDITWKIMRRAGSATGTVRMISSEFRFRDATEFVIIASGTDRNYTPGNTNSNLLSVVVAAVNFQAGDVIRIDFQRVGGDASDTLAAAVGLDGVWIEYTGRA